MVTLTPCFVDSHFDVIRATGAPTAVGPTTSFLNNADRGCNDVRVVSLAGKHTAVQAFPGSRIASRTFGTLRASLPHVMATNGRNDLDSVVVVTLDRVTQGVAEIRSVLDSLGIPAEVVESGRRLRWKAAVVLRIPEQRIPEALLALGLKGFTDVMAYQSTEAESWGRMPGEAGGSAVR